MTRLDWDRARSRPDRGGSGRPPKDAQIAYIAKLAAQAGEHLAPPRTRADASREIDRLRRKLGKR